MSVATIDNVGGGVKLVDVNSEKQNIAYNVNPNYHLALATSTNDTYSIIPLCGYKKISVCAYRPHAIIIIDRISFRLNDGSVTSETELQNATWTDFDIPSNAINAIIHTKSSSGVAFTDLDIALYA